MTRARHWAILLLAAGCILALASGLAACGGPADGALPPPESPPPPAAPPAPAVPPGEPLATGTPATPPPLPEPEPEPEPEPLPATCTATTLGVDPAANLGLAADCAALLAAKDALRGWGALNWDAATALTSWDGVTVGGTPQRVTGLDLRTRQLTGTIPPALAGLAHLTDLFLAENDLTGCLPRAWKDVATTDFAALGLDFCALPSTTLTYGAPSTTGSVTDDGDYAFLSDPADLTNAVTTYEGLRDGTTTGLVIHQNDSAGTSQADFYDDVDAGDVVEWREADACWVRYQVTEVKDDPSGSPPRKLLAVKAYSHAYTGCSGALSATGNPAFTWTPTLVQRGNITVPIWHGPVVVAPAGWTATTLPELTPRTPNTGPWPPSIDEMPDPDLGPGWTGNVVPGLYEGLLEGYYSHSEGGNLTINIYPLLTSPFRVKSIDNAYTTDVLEFFLLDGRPAWVGYDRELGITSYDWNSVTVYDEATDLIIAASGGRRSQGNDPTELIALVRKFLAAVSPPPAETPPPPATPPDAPIPEPPAEPAAPGEPAPRSFRYDTYDRSGAVTEPGQYVFLADPADPASVVTTYEGLRDGTATALLIHTHDAHGVPQADLYGTVEAGDLVEWKQAADCFVRYQVTAVPDPPGDAVTRAFGVAWMTYAFTGCSGVISTTGTTTVDVTWGAVLSDLGGPTLTVPIRHGGAQILPRGWTGVVEAEHIVFPPAYNPDPFFWTDSLEEARRLPYWRDPVLPDGWRFGRAGTPGDAVAYGYVAYFISDEGGTGLELIGRHANPLGWNRPAAWHPTNGSLFVTETRVIAGRPAWVQYSPPGPLHRVSGARLVVFDPATASQYLLDGKNLGFGGAGVDRLIAIAASLFEPPNAP